jgi:preprotein translocase subunit SecE
VSSTDISADMAENRQVAWVLQEEAMLDVFAIAAFVLAIIVMLHFVQRDLPRD